LLMKSLAFSYMIAFVETEISFAVNLITAS